MKGPVQVPRSRHAGAVILGASGFIGINLAQELARRGYALTCFARRRSEHWPRGARAILGDIANPPAELLAAMKDAAVFHLVSTTRPSALTAAAPAEIADNLIPTVALIEQAKDSGCRWVFASSGGTVYGQTDAERIAEDHPTRPISSYGIVKLAIERYFHLYRTMHGLDYVVARISNPYGPHQSARTGQGLVAALLDRIGSGRPVEIWGDGGTVRDYIYVGDAVAALADLAERGHAGETYNVGSGIGLSINDLVRTISDLIGEPARVVHGPARGMDVRRNVLDIAKIGRDTGWRPRCPLDKGLAETSGWLRHVGTEPAATAAIGKR